jgi:hypothetical protein
MPPTNPDIYKEIEEVKSSLIRMKVVEDKLFLEL